MDNDQLKREVDYGVVISLTKEMLAQGLLDQREFVKLQRLYAEKYRTLVQSVDGWKIDVTSKKT
jgi:hypothetical protein